MQLKPGAAKGMRGPGIAFAVLLTLAALSPTSTAWAIGSTANEALLIGAFGACVTYECEPCEAPNQITWAECMLYCAHAITLGFLVSDLACEYDAGGSEDEEPSDDDDPPSDGPSDEGTDQERPEGRE